MGSLWDDRLGEVWAWPGRAGAGVVIGRDGLLTARHVIAGSLADAQGRILARVIRPGRSVAAWVPMQVEWEDNSWDLALLVLDHDSADQDSWVTPTSREPVVVALGTNIERQCETVGFPDSAVQRRDSGRPADVVRQSEQAAGLVLPAGQGKPPVSPERQLPVRWMPLDVVETTRPDTHQGWGGMSGAGVVLPDGRLIGTVVTADPGHEKGRLYFVPLADALAEAPGLSDRLAKLARQPSVAQARDAPLYERVCQTDSLGPDGLPMRIADIADLSVFGVKPADVPGESTFLTYVWRDEDEQLRAALTNAVQAHALLLVIGGSAAGKSRSTAEAVRDLLGDHRLVRPTAGSLEQLRQLPLADAGPSVVWLDDIQQYAHASLRNTLHHLLGVGVAIVGTIRRAVLEELTRGGDIQDPTAEALTDHRLVHEVSWSLSWSPTERTRLVKEVTYSPLLDAVSKGISVGAYVVAGPRLVARVTRARDDDERPCRYSLARTVIDWYRTGISWPILLASAVALIKIRCDDQATEEELTEALNWAVQPEIGEGRKTRQSVLTFDRATETLAIHDYILDHVKPDDPVPRVVWMAALAHAPEDRVLSIAAAAHYAGEDAIARDALKLAADAGSSDAMFNLGVLLEDTDLKAAKCWYERAAARNEPRAMFNLGFMLKDGEPAAAKEWYERAAAAEHVGAMNDLGVLLHVNDPDAARAWYERAAAAGNSEAMNNLGVLLRISDPTAAAEWIQRAAAAGNAGAMQFLADVLKDAYPEA